MSIFGKITNAFHFLTDHNIAAQAAKITPLLSIALPFAKLLTAATPGDLDDRIVAKIETLGIPAASLFGEAVTGIDKILRDGGRQKVVAALLRDELIEIIKREGHVKFGDEVLTTASQVLGLEQRKLELVALQVYDLLRDHDPEIVAAKPAPAVPAPPVTVEPSRHYTTASEIKGRIEELKTKLEKPDLSEEKREDLEGRLKKQEDALRDLGQGG